MSIPTHEDANLILKLYDLRREETMRKARNFFIFFFPEKIEDITNVLFNKTDPEKSAYYRQVTTYWEMAASLVNHGTLNEQLFMDCNGEYIAVYAKVEQLLPELRKLFGPSYLIQLEKLVKRTPDYEARISTMRERLKAFAAKPAEKM